MLYPQNGDRIVTIDTLTSLYPVYRTRMLEVELIGQHGRTATGSGRNDNEAITVTVFSTTFARERDRCAPIITPPPIGERSIVMSVSVCLCVCLSARDHVFGTTRPILTKFLYMLTMAVARTSSGGFVIRYVLPVL